MSRVWGFFTRLEVPEKFLWGGGGVCKVIFMSNPSVVLTLGWGFDNTNHKLHVASDYVYPLLCKKGITF